ncbi:hypothetical protein BVF91_11555 [Thermoanaerobacterium sp. PSU-2]|uniref:hypothetical protein n=1 Tax=Thermoanaerobacterium sp. PSU-2 TaxID=1930849 RepID=UPI000A15EFEE|nr:hypothetical protein [Thermoanaerobacterium sp. PSU-2]ORX22469.1 hypothetical protein BVF91_11555 [Thermoanaerobacterium sp. PSU-2]
MAYVTPKTNWQASDVVQPADMNRIEQNTVELKKAATIDVADANGYFTTTPKTVESALQELGSAVTTGKNTIASAITSMGQSASGTDTFATLASKIQAISTDANAGVGDVLSGKTFYQGGSKKTGAMANNGAVIITPSTQNQAIPAGYHNGSGYVKGDANLVAANIVAGRSIFGVSGPTAQSYSSAFTMASSVTQNIGFKPRFIVFQYQGSMTLYNSENPSENVTGIYLGILDPSRITLTNTGFTLTSGSVGQIITYIAFT